MKYCTRQMSKIQWSSILLCPIHYFVQQFTVSKVVFNIHLLSCSTFPCQYVVVVLCYDLHSPLFSFNWLFKEHQVLLFCRILLLVMVFKLNLITVKLTGAGHQGIHWLLSAVIYIVLCTASPLFLFIHVQYIQYNKLQHSHHVQKCN